MRMKTSSNKFIVIGKRQWVLIHWNSLKVTNVQYIDIKSLPLLCFPTLPRMEFPLLLLWHYKYIFIDKEVH